jgi:hypothetical protein
MKMKISEIDSNLKVNTGIKEEGMVFKSCFDMPFEIRGLAKPEKSGKLYRVSESVFPMMSESLNYLSRCTAGGRVRFRTDSPYIAIKVELMEGDKIMPHMPATGISGVDLYTGSAKKCKYKKTIIPPSHQVKEYDGIYYLENPENKSIEDITLNLPLYNGVDNLYIGLKEGSALEAPLPYSVDLPVVYYGSSITQGGCASRPGNSFDAIVSRWLDCDHVNLGFSGNGFGELFMAEYIAALDMSACVIDSFNIKDKAHIQAAHEPFFKTIRAARPDLPVVIISVPAFVPDPPANKEYREIIRQTYENAVKAGDGNVWYIDGETIYGSNDTDACTVDCVHPNDFGFMRMAKSIYPVVRQALNLT